MDKWEGKELGVGERNLRESEGILEDTRNLLAGEKILFGGSREWVERSCGGR